MSTKTRVFSSELQGNATVTELYKFSHNEQITSFLCRPDCILITILRSAHNREEHTIAKIAKTNGALIQKKLVRATVTPLLICDAFVYGTIETFMVSTPKEVTLWNVDLNCRPQSLYKQQDGEITFASISPDNSLTFITNTNGTVAVQDFQGQNVIYTLNVGDAMYHCCNPTMYWAVFLNENELYAAELEYKRTALHITERGEKFTCFAFSTDGQSIIIGTQSGALYAYRVINATSDNP
jgi:hypothetical protein